LISTENGSVGQKEEESNTLQEIRDSRNSEKGLDENYLSSLVTDRLKDEALEEPEASLVGDELVNKNLLLLPSELAEQMCSEVNASWASEIIPEFELDHNGMRIISVRKLRKNHARVDRPTWRTEE
jgi:hypothetical protein